MGDNTLPQRSQGQTISADWFNAIRTAMLLNWLPRNASGVVTASAGSLGSADYPWAGGYLDTLTVGGTAIDPNRLGLRPHRLVSGAAKASGYPQFLTAAGAGNGLSATLAATATDLELVVNSTAVTVTNDQTFTGLTAGFWSNNTCLVNDTSLAGAAATKLIGEYGRGYITIDTIGSEVSARNGQVAAFYVGGTEVMLAKIDTTNNRIYPIYRGWAGTNRVGISNNDVLTLVTVSTLLLNADGSTKIASTYFPESVTTAPAAGTAGKVYIERQTGKHAYDTGSAISYDYVILGWAICNHVDCRWVQPYDFDLSWNEDADVDWYVSSNTAITVKAGSFAWVGRAECGFSIDVSATQASNMDSGSAISADADFYVYVKHDGGVVFSTVAPRLNSFLVKGAYHPQNYYRCVGIVRTDSSSYFKTTRGRRVANERLADALVPVGAVVPFVPGSFANGSNGTYAAVDGTTASALNSQLPPNWRVCDGSAFYDLESPIFSTASRYLPNLTDDRFLMGDTAAGTAANASYSHTHDISHVHMWSFMDKEADSDKVLYSLASVDDSAITIGNGDTAFIGQPAGAAVQGGATYSYFASISPNADTYGYTTGVLGGPSGSGAAAVSGAPSNESVVPKHLTCFFIMRVK